MVEKLNFENFQENPPIEKIESEAADNAGVQVFVKREDLIHEQLSGNKWRKLKYNLLQAKAENRTNLLTFGGAYSNHIAAVAAAGAIFGFKTTGIIRGEEPSTLNHTLAQARKNGMELKYVSRSAYRDKSKFITQFLSLENKGYIIPEGGTNKHALKGCKEILSFCDFEKKIDYWCVACGTGGTAAGMITGLRQDQHLIGFSVLKGDFMTQEIHNLLLSVGADNQNWSVNNQFHFGGYTKFDASLIKFINDFKYKYDIPLDPVYTGKLFFAVFELISKNYFPKGSNIMIVHSGGQQGIAGFNERFGPIIH